MKIRRMLWRLKTQIRIYWLLFKDKRTPKISKIMLIAAMIYLIWPFDIIPDIIPFAGFVDELIIVPLLFYLATMFIPRELVNEYRNKTKKNVKTKFENVQEGEIIG